jgi:hypothetical protein
MYKLPGPQISLYPSPDYFQISGFNNIRNLTAKNHLSLHNGYDKHLPQREKGRGAWVRLSRWT